MKRHLVIAGRGLAGIGLTSGLGYLIATKASNAHHPPVWPYFICAAVLIAGIAVYFSGTPLNSKPDQEERTLQGMEEAHEEAFATRALNKQSAPTFTSRWRCSASEFELGSPNLENAFFLERNYVLSVTERQSPSVCIGMLIACDPLAPTTAGTELRSRFRDFLTQPAIMGLVAEMTHVSHDDRWVSLAGNGLLMLQASLTAGEENTAPVASAIFVPSAAGQTLDGREPRCAELRICINPRNADGSAASPMRLADWQSRFTRALAVPRLLADFVSNDLGITASDDPHARFGIRLEAPGPLTGLIDIGGLSTLPGRDVSNQFTGWAIADPNGNPATATAREFVTQLCEHALNLDNYEWALPPIEE
jgi:hypothetical protein